MLGYPAKAAALILDFGPRPPAAVLPDKCFHLSATGPDGAWFRIEYTTDLRNWTGICTNQVFNGYVDFTDPDGLTSKRFYRTVPEANAPAE